MIDKIRTVVLKMGVFKAVLFLISVSVVSCNEYVPVLVWGTQTTEDYYPVITALSRLSSNEFSDYLLKRIRLDNPVILLFVEENLSVEDFSWKDLNGNGAFPMLSNLTRMADDVAFLTSVHEPYKAIKKLKNHGYNWKVYEKENFESLKDGENSIFEVKLDEPNYLEDRPDMLKRHDEKMTKVYNKALSYRQNVMVIYTGSHTSWIDAELGRFKREEKETNGSTLIIRDANNVVRISVTTPIVFMKRDKDNKAEVVHINNVIGTPTINELKEISELIFRVRFPLKNEEALVNFKFFSDGYNWWNLKSADMPEMKELNLYPSDEITAPNNFSFFCNPIIEFSNGNALFKFENFQVQPRVGEGKDFGPVIHCIPYFSVAILSGLCIVFVLSVVLSWGITMLLDINTNDKFDDPKGKTIFICASD